MFFEDGLDWDVERTRYCPFFFFVLLYIWDGGGGGSSGPVRIIASGVKVRPSLINMWIGSRS